MKDSNKDKQSNDNDTDNMDDYDIEDSLDAWEEEYYKEMDKRKRKYETRYKRGGPNRAH